MTDSNDVLAKEGFSLSGGQTRRGSCFYFALWTTVYLSFLLLIYATGGGGGTGDGKTSSFVVDQRSASSSPGDIFPEVACWFGLCASLLCTILTACRDYHILHSVEKSATTSVVAEEEHPRSPSHLRSIATRTPGVVIADKMHASTSLSANKPGPVISPESRYILERAVAIQAGRAAPVSQWEDLSWAWPLPTIITSVAVSAIGGTPQVIGAVIMGFLLIDLGVFFDPTAASLLSPRVFTLNLFVTLLTHLIVFVGSGIAVRDWEPFWIAIACLVSVLSLCAYPLHVLKVKVRSLWYTNGWEDIAAGSRITQETTSPSAAESGVDAVLRRQELLALRPMRSASDTSAGTGELNQLKLLTHQQQQPQQTYTSSTYEVHTPTEDMNEGSQEHNWPSYSSSRSPSALIHLKKVPPPPPPPVGPPQAASSSAWRERLLSPQSAPSLEEGSDCSGTGRRTSDHNLGPQPRSKKINGNPVENLALMSISEPVRQGTETALFCVVDQDEPNLSTSAPTRGLTQPSILEVGAKNAPTGQALEQSDRTISGSTNTVAGHAYLNAGGAGSPPPGGSLRSNNGGGSMNGSKSSVNSMSGSFNGTRAGGKLKTQAYMEMERDERNERIEQRQGKKTVPYKLGNVIGSGATGVVHLALIVETAETVCAKQIHFVGLGEGGVERQLARAKTEIQMLKTLDHPNIVRYFFTDKYTNPETNNTSLLIFMEYVAGGSLQDYVKQFGRMDERTCAIFAAQLLLGLEYLHSRKVTHRDIKPANCLVATNGVAKLTDFGTAWMNEGEEDTGPEETGAGGDKNGATDELVTDSPCEDTPVAPLAGADSSAGSSGDVGKKKGKKAFDLSGTPYYMAPEVIRGTDCSWRGDIWAFGCTLMELLTGKNPWAHLSDNAFRILSLVAKSEEELELPESISPLAAEFLKKCLCMHPSHRWPATLLLRDPFLQQFDLFHLSYSEAQVAAASVSSNHNLQLVQESISNMNPGDNISGGLNILNSKDSPLGRDGPTGILGAASATQRQHISEAMMPEDRKPPPTGVALVIREVDERNQSGSTSQGNASAGHSSSSNPKAPVLNKEQKEELKLMQGSLALKPDLPNEVSASVSAKASSLSRLPSLARLKAGGTGLDQSPGDVSPRSE